VSLGAVGGGWGPAAVEEQLAFGELPQLQEKCVLDLPFHGVGGGWWAGMRLTINPRFQITIDLIIPTCSQGHLGHPEHLGLDPLRQVSIKPAC
jgi:hypothetical protein